LAVLLQQVAAVLAPDCELPEGGRDVGRLRQQVQGVLGVVPEVRWALHSQAEEKLSVAAEICEL